jgi:hypothetical protein
MEAEFLKRYKIPQTFQSDLTIMQVLTCFQEKIADKY